jgi:hypothetical protein
LLPAHLLTTASEVFKKKGHPGNLEAPSGASSETVIKMPKIFVYSIL